MNTTHVASERREAGAISLDFTWSGTLPLLLAGLLDGTSTGKAMAREHLSRMAAVADLAVQAASALQQITENGVDLPPGALEAIKHWHRVARSTGTDALREPSVSRSSQAEFSIGYCVNGFYIGICDSRGECQRRSVETWPSREAARRALDDDSWTPRDE